jgi:hypothetical protein
MQRTGSGMQLQLWLRAAGRVSDAPEPAANP